VNRAAFCIDANASEHMLFHLRSILTRGSARFTGGETYVRRSSASM
jgi:hypothetical protein